MERTEIFKGLQLLFKKLMEDETVIITEETSEDDIDKWNSLFQTQLVVELEEKYAIKFNLREIITWETVSDIIDSIEDHL